MPHAVRLVSPPLVWALAAGCWWWLFTGARGRARLLARLAVRHGGKVRRRFSFGTFTAEAVELTFLHMAGRLPVTMRLTFAAPPRGGLRPGTAFECELPEASLGAERGAYLPADLAAGRGLFLGGANLTAAYAGLVGTLPGPLRPVLRWQGHRACLFLPALLGERDEWWAERCLAFMRELADGAAAS